MSKTYSLTQLGWSPFFQQQLSFEQWQACKAARVMEVHRSGFVLAAEAGQITLERLPSMQDFAIGDWLLLDQENRVECRLERSSLLSRKAAGETVAQQNIAANVDTLFIVCSANQDFNLNRVERFLALAHEAGAQPVVVLSKVDQCESPEDYLDQLRGLDPMLMVEGINCLEPASTDSLRSWCSNGKTVALLGSSGVGKSTLVNTLIGVDEQQTGDIRHDDDKGKHTTTARSVHFLATGGLLIDTPGMRELQLADCDKGLEATFSDIVDLAEQCRFADCQHQSEPGCAVKRAIENGELDARRLRNYLKLEREQSINSATLAEKRARDKDLSKMYKRVQGEARRYKNASN